MNQPWRSVQTPSGMWMWEPPPERVPFGIWIEPTSFIPLDPSDLDLCPGSTCLLYGQSHEHAWRAT